MDELLKALNGGKGSLDAWLEVCSEDEVRAAILGLVSPTETLRDKFAGRAMQGAVTGLATREEAYSYAECAALAYEQADAMLAERHRVE